MGESIGHNCGLAMVRLRQPLSHYGRHYGDIAWGLRRLYLLMEKQHNRGQDGAGIAAVKFDMPPGEQYLRRVRTDRRNSLERVFDAVMSDIRLLEEGEHRAHDAMPAKRRCEFLGEVYLGHLRYGTHAGHGVDASHPLIRKSNTASRNLAVAGNFNMTNSAALFRQLIDYGLNPVGDSDTQVILERLGYCLDCEHDYLQGTMGPESLHQLDGRELARAVSEQLDYARILTKAAEDWDGGYVFASLVGNGDVFVCRDPAGIRPGFFLANDEVVAVASERAALANVFDVQPDEISQLQPGHVLIIKRDGTISEQPFRTSLEERQCTFERIYFSRGNDPQIYEERKELGRRLAPRVLDVLDGDVTNAVFSFIPNTAETAYLGLVEELDRLNRKQLVDALLPKVDAGTVSRADLDGLLNGHIRAEKIAHKDQRLRTFITHDAERRNLVLHIYDITRGIVKPDDTLVVLDDSIVRGTTLRESIITILTRLNPRRIVIVSSAPPVMYPDCYGIDMSQLGRFIAFEAAVALLNERGLSNVLDEVEERCLAQSELPPHRMENHVAAIYEPFSLDELSARIADLVRPPAISWAGDITIVYQSRQGLSQSIPTHTGDWVFTGRYPTPGGYGVLNRSYLNWRSNQDVRAY